MALPNKVCPSQEEMFADAQNFFANPAVSTPLVLCISTLLFVVVFRSKGENAKLSTIEAFLRELGGSTCKCRFINIEVVYSVRLIVSNPMHMY